MKNIKSTVTYTVPHWNYCNSDDLINGCEMSKNTCRFCVKTKTGYDCLLYNQQLDTSDDLIIKAHDCCKATAGYAVSINATTPPPKPTISPRELMKETIDLYNKTVNDLIAQGYPRQMADKAAKKYILDN